MRQNSLTRFEMIAKRLVEDSFGRLFGKQLELLDVASRITLAMGDSMSSGNPASSFHVALNPQDYAAVMASNPQAAQLLSSYVAQLAQEAELTLSEQPHVTLVADSHLRRRKVMVQIETVPTSQGMTTQIHPPTPASKTTSTAIRELDAFLVVAGRSHRLLEQPLITIGRRADNDIVLKASSVSRRHAQLRWRFGRFILYDVSGRGQTKVNGRTVTEYVLQTSDVISLGDVQLIYGEGRDRSQGMTRFDDQVGGSTIVRSPLE